MKIQNIPMIISIKIIQPNSLNCTVYYAVHRCFINRAETHTTVWLCVLFIRKSIWRFALPYTKRNTHFIQAKYTLSLNDRYHVSWMYLASLYITCTLFLCGGNTKKRLRNNPKQFVYWFNFRKFILLVKKSSEFFKKSSEQNLIYHVNIYQYDKILCYFLFVLALGFWQVDAVVNWFSK